MNICLDITENASHDYHSPSFMFTRVRWYPFEYVCVHMLHGQHTPQSFISNHSSSSVGLRNPSNHALPADTSWLFSLLICCYPPNPPTPPFLLPVENRAVSLERAAVTQHHSNQGRHVHKHPAHSSDQGKWVKRFASFAMDWPAGA